MILRPLMQNISQTAVSIGLIAIAILAGCVAEAPPAQIALLAPFEGRYREVGYDALYAVNLAIADSGITDIALLAIDDGGSPETAVLRARALVEDQRVKAGIVVGYDASADQVLDAFGDMPIFVVGSWAMETVDSGVFVMNSQYITEQLSNSLRIDITEAAEVNTPFIGGDVFGLHSYPELRTDLSGITVLSSGSLPSQEYVQRILEANAFASPPGLLSTLTYDTMRFAIEIVEGRSTSREVIAERANTLIYEGLNGTISFEDGYWVDAPNNAYIYDSSGELIRADDIVE